MAKRKQIGLGTLVQWDPLNGTSYQTIGFARTFADAPRTGTEADGKVLTDSFDVPLPGIEDVSEFTFNEFWHPGEAEDELIDTAFNNRLKTDGTELAAFRIVYPHNGLEPTDTAPTSEFSGTVLSITPDSVDEPNGLITRQVTVRRTTAVTRGTFVIPGP